MWPLVLVAHWSVLTAEDVVANAQKTRHYEKVAVFSLKYVLGCRLSASGTWARYTADWRTKAPSDACQGRSNSVLTDTGFRAFVTLWPSYCCHCSSLNDAPEIDGLDTDECETELITPCLLKISTCNTVIKSNQYYYQTPKIHRWKERLSNYSKTPKNYTTFCHHTVVWRP